MVVCDHLDLLAVILFQELGMKVELQQRSSLVDPGGIVWWRHLRTVELIFYNDVAPPACRFFSRESIIAITDPDGHSYGSLLEPCAIIL